MSLSVRDGWIIAIQEKAHFIYDKLQDEHTLAFRCYSKIIDILKQRYQTEESARDIDDETLDQLVREFAANRSIVQLDVTEESEIDSCDEGSYGEFEVPLSFSSDDLRFDGESERSSGDESSEGRYTIRLSQEAKRLLLRRSLGSPPPSSILR